MRPPLGQGLLEPCDKLLPQHVAGELRLGQRPRTPPQLQPPLPLVAQQAGVGDRCQFQVLDFMAAQPARKYDLAAACGVFDYVQDAEAFLGHMAKYANRVIYGSFPGPVFPRAPIRKVRYALRGCPLHFYSRRDLEKLFGAVGFGRCVLKPVSGGHLAWAVKE